MLLLMPVGPLGMSAEGVLLLDQIDVLLKEISSAESNYSTIGVNCLLPVDCSKDVIKLLNPLLVELKEQLLKGKEYNSYTLGLLLGEKFIA